MAETTAEAIKRHERWLEEQEEAISRHRVWLQEQEAAVSRHRIWLEEHEAAMKAHETAMRRMERLFDRGLRRLGAVEEQVRRTGEMLERYLGHRGGDGRDTPDRPFRRPRRRPATR